MGRRNRNPKPNSNPNPNQNQLLETLGDFSSKENWDKFFTIRGNDSSFEWYAECPQLRDPLLSLLSQHQSAAASSSLQILVPGCGNSRMSEELYDEGFRGITNVDFSKVVIADMLRRNVRERAGMRWRVMDMTALQFEDGTFDVVLDKGGLDALMEPELGSTLGNQYLSEVKRVLKFGGKFICLTLAESHVLGLLFPKFRFGWKMFLHSMPLASPKKLGLRTFMAVIEKDDPRSLNQIVASLDLSTLERSGDQARGLFNAIETENNTRQQYLDESGVIFSLEDLRLGAEADLCELKPGRSIQLTLGIEGESRFSYRAVLLDARQSDEPFLYHCGVFLVPKERTHEWLFSSVEGQWAVVESSKAARLIMILLDSSHAVASMDEIQNDLSPLVKQLEPQKHITGSKIPFMMAGDGIRQRKLVHLASSKLTGPIVVEDVIYETTDDSLAQLFPGEELKFRRLVFRRTEGLVQSEALLTKSSREYVGEAADKKTKSGSKLKTREKHKPRDGLDVNLAVDHKFLASSYHMGIIAGFTLISSYLQSMVSNGKMVEAVVIGLGAGLLPMFLHKFIPFFLVEVVELDPEVLSLARDYFSFQEDENLKVHLADGVDFIKNFREPAPAVDIVDDCRQKEPICDPETSASVCSVSSEVGGKLRQDIDLIIVDVDSSDSSSGLSCPAAAFVEDSFFSTVSDALSEKGLFVMNLVSRSPSIKSAVVSRMKKVFSQLYCLQLEEDVNEVLFALKTNSYTEGDDFSEASVQLKGMLKLDNSDIIQRIFDTAKKIKCLK